VLIPVEERAMFLKRVFIKNNGCRRQKKFRFSLKNNHFSAPLSLISDQMFRFVVA
jgi:hypothetical protein